VVKLPTQHKALADSQHSQPDPVGIPDQPGLPRIEIGALLGEKREAILMHNGEAYRLRVTANNKLILTK
jgi:hemin uptake protein HemP